MSRIVHHGLMPLQEDKNYDFCGDNKANIQSQLCTEKYLQSEELLKFYGDNCEGKVDCKINLSQFVTPGDDSCQLETSSVYAQFFCDIEHHKKDHLYIQLTLSATSVVISLIFLFQIYFLKKSDCLDFKRWDLNHIRVSDYTVQITITDRILYLWKREISLREETQSFKDFIKNSIE